MSKSKLELPKPGNSNQVQQDKGEPISRKRVAPEKNCHAMTIGERELEYDYETILEKILDEKKLALSRSPEVIRFLRELKPQNGASASHHRGRVTI